LTSDYLHYYPDLVPAVASHLGCEFLDGWILFDHDDDLRRLGSKLKKYSQKKFEPNEKFFIGHFDTEYFAHGLGFTAYNFSNLIKSLDIDPCRFVIAINQHHGSESWLQYCADPKNQYIVIESPLTGLVWRSTVSPKFFDSTECKYHFCSMIYKSRMHRDLFARALVSKDLVEKNLISIHLESGENDGFFGQLPDDDFDVNYREITTRPFSRINEAWQLDSELQKLYQVKLSLPYININIDQDINQDSSRFVCDWYQKIFVDLVTETVYNYPYAFISEKTLRPIVSSRPFIIIGAPGTLAWLKDLGFQTFDNFWDESYDNVQDANQRFNMILNLIDTVSSWSIDQCQHKLTQMANILQHNQENYKMLLSNTLLKIQ